MTSLHRWLPALCFSLACTFAGKAERPDGHMRPPAAKAANTNQPLTAGSPRLAVSARLDLVGNEDVGALENGHITAGDGALTRVHWLSPQRQKQSYSAEWTVAPFAWRTAGVRFQSRSNGVVTVRLRGPWQEEEPGKLYHQEVYWDGATARGTILSNRSFEVHHLGVPDSWSHPWSQATPIREDPRLAAHGTHFVATWANGPVETSVRVRAGIPVSLTFQVRAAMPSNRTEQACIESTNTPAHRAMARFRRGVNLANDLEAPPGSNWGTHHDATDLAAIAGEGFDHVRIPVAWHYHCGPPPTHTISRELFAAVDALVTNALDRGLGVIVDVHHFENLAADPNTHSNRLFRMWEQIAAHYAGYPQALAFEILNEPHGGATTEWMNGFYAAVLPAIRASGPNRTVFLEPGNWGSIRELGRLSLPAGDSNLVVSVHSYAPFLFTHQGAPWCGTRTVTTNIVYPGPPPTPVRPPLVTTNDAWVVDWFEQYNREPTRHNPCSLRAFSESLVYARDWSVHSGRPIHVGEFGCYRAAPQTSRIRFYREKRQCLDRLRLGWATWDWKAGFAYWDTSAGKPVPGMRGSLLPTTPAHSPTSGE
jgi:endoglucanase